MPDPTYPNQYVTVAEMRAEGVPMSITSDRIVSALMYWQTIIERVCRQFFNSRALTLTTNGTGGAILWLPVPIISVESLYVNLDFVNEIPQDTYKIYNGRQLGQDDRQNPKIVLTADSTSIYTSQRSSFVTGKANQRIVGNFGYTEEDGTTPLPIKLSLQKLAIKSLRAAGSTGLWGADLAGPPPSGLKTMEMTDGHMVQYANMFASVKKPGLMGLVGDVEIATVLEYYRGPLSLGAPMSYGEGILVDPSRHVEIIG